MRNVVSLAIIIFVSGLIGGCLEKQPVKETETGGVSDSPSSISTGESDGDRILIKKEFSEEQKKLIKQLGISADLENPDEVFSIYFFMIEERERNSSNID
jgi:hypothetical protein